MSSYLKIFWIYHIDNINILLEGIHTYDSPKLMNTMAPASSIVDSLKHSFAPDNISLSSADGSISKLTWRAQLTSMLPLLRGNFTIIYVVILLFHKTALQ